MYAWNMVYWNLLLRKCCLDVCGFVVQIYLLNPAFGIQFISIRVVLIYLALWAEYQCGPAMLLAGAPSGKQCSVSSNACVAILYMI